jgi:hypothetical protein
MRRPDIAERRPPAESGAQQNHAPALYIEGSHVRVTIRIVSRLAAESPS